MILNRINFRGYEAYITDEKIPSIDRDKNLHYYEIRHSDEDSSEPVTLENCVFVNRWGTIVFKESINHLLTEWAETRFETVLTEDEQSDFYSAISDREGRVMHNEI